MTQEFHISVTPIRDNEYLVRTERVAPGVPLAEEQVIWPVDEWLHRASLLMHDPLQGVLRGDGGQNLSFEGGQGTASTSVQTVRSTSLVVFGQVLYNALFQGTIRDSWVMAQGIAQHRQEVLRLRLGLKDNRLPRLPWEVLHAGDRPIATGTDVVFSRYHSSFAAISSSSRFQQLPVVEADQPLKILMVLAAPTDQEVLALKQEALHLQEELQGTWQNGNRSGKTSEIHLTILEQPGREQLAQALEHNHYQVLHYAGHSNLGEAGGKLYLVSNRTGLTETLNGDDLAGLLVNNGVRMAVFNSCRGVYTATSEAAGEGNLAEALVKRGIPAVLAMAERIPDDIACNLSRLFYRNLKQFYPIDLSLNRARQGLLSSCGSNQLYWALPILYLQPEFNGYLVSSEDGAEEMAGMLRHPQGALYEKSVLGSASGMPAFRVGQSLEEGLLEETDLELGAIADPDAFADFLDPDELEDDLYDDPEDTSGETVAQLVQRLSEPSQRRLDEAPLPASAVEDLLPSNAQELTSRDYLDSQSEPSLLGLTSPNQMEPAVPAPIAARLEAVPSAVMDVDDGSVYLELERLLAETGKLTAAIATCNQAIRENPANPEAYDCLGQALSRQGYLVEAIAAYEQAIRVNPTLAQAHTHLGQALYQQGKVKESIRAFSRAIQLAPDSIETRQNLELALQRQGVRLPAEQSILLSSGQSSLSGLTQNGSYADRVDPVENSRVNISPSRSQRQAHATGVSWVKAVCWLGAGTVAATVLTLGFWLYQNQTGMVLFSQPRPSESIPPAVENFNELKKANNSVVTAYATEKLNTGNIAAARGAIEILLDRQALSQASAALTPILSKQAENPTINFLMGRLAWQSVAQQNSDYDSQDARRYWEMASKRQPTPLYYNALGFAYYAEGELDRARESWLKTLQLTESSSNSTRTVSSQAVGSGVNSETLTAYAGIAMVLMKTAEAQPPSKRAMTQTKVIELRERILVNDPVNFQTNALGKNWMWSEQAIRDWEKLLTLQ